MLPFRGDERCLVACHDDQNLWGDALQSAVTSAVSPLCGVQLSTRFGDVPTGAPRWGIPQSTEIAAQTPLQFVPAAAAGAEGNLANSFAAPYCHIGFVSEKDNEAKKAELQAWASEKESRCEPCLLVFVGKSADAGPGLLSRALSFKGTGEDGLAKTLAKLRDDFPARWCRLDAPAPSPEQLDEFRAQLEECVAAAVATRVDTLLESLEALEVEQTGSTPEGAEASFYRYFSAKEGLAIVYQQVGLPGLALSVYSELEEEYENLMLVHWRNLPLLVTFG